MAVNNENGGPIDQMLTSLYTEIMTRRYNLQLIYMAGFKGMDSAEIAKKTEEMTAEEMLLDKAQTNFDKTIRTQTLMANYNKKTGKDSSQQENTLLSQLEAIKSGMPSIVSSVPVK